MEKIIAYCGYICNECPVYIATRDNDNDKKIELSKQWSNEKYTVTPEDINCLGCSPECSHHFRFCGECEIRLCGLNKKIKNCAYCNEYPCDKLNKPFEITPQSKILLDEIRKNL